MISIERALDIVAGATKKLGRSTPAESVPLEDSPGRILREDIDSDSDYPPFDKAIRDGFAVRFEDLASVPAELKIIGESRAGQAAAETVGVGTCCEIMTGAPLPDGANAVVMVEHTERVPDFRVRILRGAREGDGILRRAAELHRGDRVLRPGRRIQLADIGTMASFGKTWVSVSSRPRVAILATGDELVELQDSPGMGQIRNSNSYTLHAQTAAAGGMPVLLGIGRDNLTDLRERVQRGLECDVLLVSGGVSMGKYDLVESVFAEFGVDVLFESVSMKPGKPTVFGLRSETFVFGLPGNPVSTMVAFHLFVEPVIQSLLQAEDAQDIRTMRTLGARLETPAKRDPARTAIIPALVRFDGNGYYIKTAPWKGSSDLAGLSRANALVVIPLGEGFMQAGDWADFIPLESRMMSSR